MDLFQLNKGKGKNKKGGGEGGGGMFQLNCWAHSKDHQNYVRNLIRRLILILVSSHALHTCNVTFVYLFLFL